MDPATRQLIEAIHRAPYHCVFAITGGGAEAVGSLLSVPGGSRTILDILVPYHAQSFREFLGHEPAQFCSAETSQQMAVRALERARGLRPGKLVLGLGGTAALATDRPKRGEHRFHLTLCTDERSATYSLTLLKGARDRAGEEGVVRAVLLNALAEAVGVAERLPLPVLAGEQLQTSSSLCDDLFSGLLRGEHRAVLVEADGRVKDRSVQPRVLLPGAFNPVHVGHWELAAVASRLTGHAVAFELSVVNVDKPALPVAELRRRLHQFQWRAPVWATRAPTFLEKAELFAGATFVVGADTAERIVAPRYYGNREELMTAALDSIRGHGCRFLVAARANPKGTLISLETLALPAAAAGLFAAIPETEFRVAVSSTALREASAQRALVANGDDEP